MRPDFLLLICRKCRNTCQFYIILCSLLIICTEYTVSNFARLYCLYDDVVVFTLKNRSDLLIGAVLRYFQHAHFIPIVCVGKERRTLIGP